MRGLTPRALELLKRRRRIAALYLRGRLQWEIAGVMGLAQSTVSDHLATLSRQWKQSALADFDEKKARELAKVDELERTYWQAWRRSMAEQEQTATEKQEGNGNSRLKASRRVQKRDGNPAFLAGIQWCIDKRCQILGLDAPPRSRREPALSSASWGAGKRPACPALAEAGGFKPVAPHRTRRASPVLPGPFAGTGRGHPIRAEEDRESHLAHQPPRPTPDPRWQVPKVARHVGRQARGYGCPGLRGHPRRGGRDRLHPSLAVQGRAVRRRPVVLATGESSPFPCSAAVEGGAGALGCPQ
jgi:hypothetical protein